MSRRASAFAGAAMVGLVGGWLLARRYDRAHRSALFSPRARERFAALGWLAAEGDAQHVGLVRDYLAWERLPTLRRRGEQVLRSLRQMAAT